MTKVFLVVFGLLTAGSVYLTVADVGLMDPSITKHSVRQGSAHRGNRRGIRAGK